MKTSFISNLSVQSAMRSTINQIQGELIDAQREVVSGRHSNLGEVLGATTSRSLNLHRDLSMMNNLLSTNSVVTQRLSSTQMAMETISNAAQTGLNTFVALAGSTDSTQLGTAVQTLTDVMDQFTTAANTSVNGEYVLAGINTDVKPVANFLKDEGGLRTDIQGWIASLGSPIAAADMETFLTTVIEPMFLDPSSPDYKWATWSSASDTPVTSRISKTEVVQTSTTTNADGFRYLAMASVVGIELLNQEMSVETRRVVSDWAIGKMGQAINGVNAERSQLGLSENRVAIANETLQAQIDIIKLNLDDLEGVDVYAASTRITALTNQMEISYNLTARISQLSLVNEL
ncbi:flagellar hook-associated family protein [Rhizobium sp. KVB221]|uniref:Flagellin n=1 Tax=Rhizobium setariae TaxID=2801340 RepID=A0A936YQV0_9HYPH|nr:flagellar hook-associated family protein [Rhizobium setariae]MBL0370695.1 flagellar hook-associated family protein [Rhizobium setariae]